jgi:type III secretion protein L
MELVVLSALPGHTVAATGRVIKAADSAKVAQALALLESAKAITKERHRLVQEAVQAGHAQGLQTGREQARDEYAARLANAEAARHTTLRYLRPALVDVVMQAVELVVRGTDRQDLLAKALESVDMLVRQARWARLRVHPSAVEAARAALADHALGPATHMDIVGVVADADVGLDGCIFETDVGIADASLDVQLEALRVAVAAAVDDLPDDLSDDIQADGGDADGASMNTAQFWNEPL